MTPLLVLLVEGGEGEPSSSEDPFAGRPEYSPEWLARWQRVTKVTFWLSLGLLVAAIAAFMLTSSFKAFWIPFCLSWGVRTIGTFVYDHIDRRQKAVINFYLEQMGRKL